jgi:hypothetical protein
MNAHMWMRAYVRVCVELGARVRTCACSRVALHIQRAVLMCHIVCGSSVFTSFFFTFSHQGHDFRKKLRNIKCPSILSINFI